MQNKLHNGHGSGGPFLSDTRFDRLYPLKIQELAVKHWTPLYIARKAAKFLVAESGLKILDIGSGIGKFCLAGASHFPQATFYGVEQRAELVYYADKVKQQLKIDNAFFYHSNFTQVNLRQYDHFYFYNSFYENLVGTDKIDNSIHYSSELFNYYNRYLFAELEKMPVGTRLATFHSMEGEVPPCYQVVGAEKDNLLKCWIKI